MGRKIFVSFFITVVVLSAATALIWWVALPLFARLPVMGGFGINRAVVSFHEQFQLNSDVPALIFGSSHIQTHSDPIVETTGAGPRIFIPASFVKEAIDPFVFWDERAGVFFISTPRAMLEFTPGSSTYSLTDYMLNVRALPLSTPIRRIDGEVYLPAD